MNQLLADLLTAQEAESRRRMTHWPQAPNPYFKGAEDMVNRWWTGVVDRTGQIVEGIANFPEEMRELADPEYMATRRKPTFDTGLDLALTFIPGSPAKVAKAEAMAKKGASREEIWDKLLLYKGPEGKWRTEISDDKAIYHGKNLIEGLKAQGIEDPLSEVQRFKLTQVLEHPELYKAQPHLKKGTVISNPRLTGSGTQGMYGQETKNITLSPEVFVRPFGGRKVTLHETMHGIQGPAGFALGGDPGAGLIGALSDAQQLIAKAQALMAKEPNAPKLDELMEAITTGKIDGETFEREYERVLESFKNYEAIKRLNEAASAVMKSPGEAYRRLAGEAEARNVETRLDWTPEQRRATPPWKSLDVPEDELIVRHQQELAKALEDPQIARAKAVGADVDDVLYRGGQVPEDGLMGDQWWFSRYRGDAEDFAKAKGGEVNEFVKLPGINVLKADDEVFPLDKKAALAKLLEEGGLDKSARMLNKYEGVTNFEVAKMLARELGEPGMRGYLGKLGYDLIDSGGELVVTNWNKGILRELRRAKFAPSELMNPSVLASGTGLMLELPYLSANRTE